tara:strand:+ start:2166 stop:2609 length:444 start_codon:yes stop_codon:yes gene_type:complete
MSSKKPHTTSHEFVPTPKPCNDHELIARHIETFANNFVIKAHQDRVKQKLIALKFKGWDKIKLQLPHWLDSSKCAKLTGRDKFPQILKEQYGDNIGIYLNFRDSPCFLTLKEAASIHFEDALFSLDGGKLVFFFTHEDEVYVCKMPQ